MVTYQNKIDNDNYYHYQIWDVLCRVLLSRRAPLPSPGY